jgi:hypothetical protein
MSGEGVFVVASANVVGGGFSRRGCFLAGISSACGDGNNGAAIFCGDGAIYKGSVRLAAFRRTVNARFMFGTSLTVSVGIEASAWSIGFCKCIFEAVKAYNRIWVSR